MRTGKTPQHKSTYTINTRLCHRGSNPAPASSHPVRSHYSGAGHRPACQAVGSKRRRRGIGGGGFLIWTTVVKGVFFTRERILRSSTTVVFRGLPGLLVLLSSPVHSFFLRMFQTVVLATPNVFAISLMGLFCFFSLMMACFTDSDSSLDLVLTVDSNRF